MSDEDLCFTTCLAAKRLGIGIRDIGGAFEWVDMAARVFIKCEPNPDRKQALVNACRDLNDYFCSPQETKTA